MSDDKKSKTKKPFQVWPDRRNGGLDKLTRGLRINDRYLQQDMANAQKEVKRQNNSKKD